MKTTKHVGLKLSVVMGFISIFFMAWLSFWVFGDLDLNLYCKRLIRLAKVFGNGRVYWGYYPILRYG